MKKKLKPRKVNPMALSLRHSLFRKQVIINKKVYNRKKVKRYRDE